MDGIKRPILGNAKEYSRPYENDNGGPKRDTRPTFAHVREKLLSNIEEVSSVINNTPEEFKLDDYVINMKMHIDYSSKSYHPDALIKQTKLDEVGTKKWMLQIKNDKGKVKTKIGKEIFIRVNKENLNNLKSLLLLDEDSIPKSLVENIRSVEDIYVEDHQNIMRHFNKDWVEGRVEIVVHPYGNKIDDMLQKLINLIDKSGGDVSKIKTKTYPSGLIFISALLNRTTLEKVIDFNPIRTAHPLIFRGVQEKLGESTSIPIPNPPAQGMQSSIKVGVFDGGVDMSIPHFNGFVSEHNPIPTAPNSKCLEHGIGVVGATLFGNLSDCKSSILPTPPVSVESFRVFPLSDPADIDLYEVIDIIEEVVPNRNDIKIFNLSLGPLGAIDDEDITRFTYAIDLLSKDNKRWFCVAVGNDGDLADDSLRRIMAPSDAVNCMGVGSYTYDSKNKVIRAPYSCIGDGREGCKVKPDIVAFGGCATHKFHTISPDGRYISFKNGTSYSTPLVSRKAAEIIGRCNIADPLLARALLIHTAEHPKKKADKFLGNGVLKDNIEDILGCKQNEVTMVYQSTLQPKKSVRLDIPFLSDLDYSGNVEITWTLAIATNVNARNTEDYTLTCIEDTLYPNINEYNFRLERGGKSTTRKRHLIDDAAEIEDMLSNGWIQSKVPASYSLYSNKYKTEQDRKTNFKWDTIIKRKCGKNYLNVESPYLVLHAMDRFVKEEQDDVYYAVVVTVKYLTFEGDAYNLTLENYNKLQVANIRAMNELMINT